MSTNIGECLEFGREIRQRGETEVLISRCSYLTCIFYQVVMHFLVIKTKNDKEELACCFIADT